MSSSLPTMHQLALHTEPILPHTFPCCLSKAIQVSLFSQTRKRQRQTQGQTERKIWQGKAQRKRKRPRGQRWQGQRQGRQRQRSPQRQSPCSHTVSPLHRRPALPRHVLLLQTPRSSACRMPRLFQISQNPRFHCKNMQLCRERSRPACPAAGRSRLKHMYRMLPPALQRSRPLQSR
jgi:hypothetical protein